MKIKVNLLQESQKIQLKLRQMGLLLQTGSVVVLIGFGVLVAILLSYTVYLSSSEKKIVSDLEQAKLKVEDLRSVEYKNQKFKQKLSLVSLADGEHYLRHRIATDFFSFATGYITISSVEISENMESFVAKGKAANVFSLANFLKDLDDFSKDQGITRVASDGFSISADGTYTFSLTLYFLQEEGGV